MATSHSRGGARPGAMTLAMQAIKSVDGPKVLRIGVIQASRIIEERVVLQRDDVTVGTTEHNTFTVAAESFPARFELFTMADGRYRLNFTDTMDGRVAMPEGVLTLAQIKQSGRAQRTANGWRIGLTEQSRGKITVADVTFLFQFVVPPPPLNRPQLPIAIRSSAVKNVDWAYSTCLASFLAIAFGGVGYVEYLYDPQVEDTFEIYQSFPLAFTPPVIQGVEPAPAPVAGSLTPTDDHASDPVTPTRTPPRDAHASNHASTDPHRAERDEAARRESEARNAEAALNAATRSADVAMRGLSHSAAFLAIANATSVDGHGSATARVANGGLMEGGVASLEPTSGITGAHSNTGINRRAYAMNGTPNGTLFGARHASGGPEIGTGPAVAPERVIVGNVAPGAPNATAGGGELPAADVASVIRRNIGGIRWCYNRALQNNPTLAGRLEVQFTVADSGRVSGTPSTSGLSEAPEVGRCIATRVHTFVFPPPSGGSVSFAFPFNFTPGG